MKRRRSEVIFLFVFFFVCGSSYIALSHHITVAVIIAATAHSKQSMNTIKNI